MTMVVRVVGLLVTMVIMQSGGATGGVRESLIKPVVEMRCESINGTRKREFVTRAMSFKPGTVHNLFFFVDAPEGRFATRDFLAEMVLEDATTPVPLYDTYLHHWLMYEYAVPKNDSDAHKHDLMEELQSDPLGQLKVSARHKDRKRLTEYPGAPDTWFLIQQFGVGAETRHTNTKMPAPYGFEGGDRFGEDYESVWVLNVHAIDTRGAISRMSCTECRCDVFDFNKTGAVILPEGYHGGLACCHDETHCLVKNEFQGETGMKLARNLRFRYTWSWTPWDECVQPLTNVRLDVTEIGFGEQLEYEVGACESNDPNDEVCIDTKVSYQRSPVSGPLISAVGHFHASGISASIWSKDGTLLCESLPIYGQGHSVGNESGYVVGITSCWPPADTGVPYYITKNEMLKFVVKYSMVDGPHTGLMGLINLKIATGRTGLV